MRFWFKLRGVPLVGAVTFGTLVALVLPFSAAAATPSPAGATVAAACLLALAVPIALGWGCSRGDSHLESVGVRPVHSLDLALCVLGVGGTGSAAMLMQEAGLAPAGAIAARAAFVYLGLMLLTQPLAGWRTAALIPAVYLLAVAVVGRGEDIIHPAPWAWIAAPHDDPLSWILTAAMLVVGTGAYGLLPLKRADEH